MVQLRRGIIGPPAGSPVHPCAHPSARAGHRRDRAGGLLRGGRQPPRRHRQRLQGPGRSERLSVGRGRHPHDAARLARWSHRRAEPHAGVSVAAVVALRPGADARIEFFEKAKRWNIAPVAGAARRCIGVVARRLLPPLEALDLVLVVAFGYFVFKAGYAQVELLFYTVLVFLMFVACWRLLTTTGRAGRGAGRLGRSAAALAQLVQGVGAAVRRPFIVVGAVRAARRCSPRPRGGRRQVGGGAGARCVRDLRSSWCFPLLLNSKRVFGHYFYNVNRRSTSGTTTGRPPAWVPTSTATA